METNSSRGDWLWLIACGLLSSLWCVTAAGQLSATFDEPTYIQVGLEHWRCGSYHGLMRLGTMPLPVDVQTLPLYLWEQYRGQPFDTQADFDQLLPWARAMTLVFWWLLLFSGLRIGRELGGPWAGRLAVAMLACEPSLVAHATLATTDIAITACLVTFAYYFRQGREAGAWRRLVLPALWLALAILAKSSGLVYGGLCMLAIEFERLIRTGALAPAEPGWRAWVRQAWRAFLPFSRDAAWIIGGGLAGVLLYCGSDWRTEPSFVRWAHTLPDGPFASTMLWLSENLRIFSNGGEGLVQQIKHNIRGHGTFILGHAYERAVWYYFPVLLTIKLTVPFLLMPLVLGVLRPRVLFNWALLTAVALFLASPTYRVQIGIRMVLPMVALAICGLSAALVTAWRELEAGWQRRLVLGTGLATVLWSTVSLGSVWPNGICYVNEFYGGTAQGYRLVSDANYDWGQGLPELARWQDDHDVKLCVWHYGTDPRVSRWFSGVLPLHSLPIHGPEDVRRLVDQRVLAVSTTLMYFSNPNGITPGHFEAVRFLRTQQPVARTTTYLIYDFTTQPVLHHEANP